MRQGDSLDEATRRQRSLLQRDRRAGEEEHVAFPIEHEKIEAGRPRNRLDLRRGYRAGWKDARLQCLDPFFASVRREPRYLALAAGMTQDIAEMRKRAAAAAPLAVQRPVTATAAAPASG